MLHPRKVTNFDFPHSSVLLGQSQPLRGQRGVEDRFDARSRREVSNLRKREFLSTAIAATTKPVLPALIEKRPDSCHNTLVAGCWSRGYDAATQSRDRPPVIGSFQPQCTLRVQKSDFCHESIYLLSGVSPAFLTRSVCHYAGGARPVGRWTVGTDRCTTFHTYRLYS